VLLARFWLPPFNPANANNKKGTQYFNFISDPFLALENGFTKGKKKA
jgi:hypothetical protein